MLGGFGGLCGCSGGGWGSLGVSWVFGGLSGVFWVFWGLSGVLGVLWGCSGCSGGFWGSLGLSGVFGVLLGCPGLSVGLFVLFVGFGPFVWALDPFWTLCVLFCFVLLCSLLYTAKPSAGFSVEGNEGVELTQENILGGGLHH